MESVSTRLEDETARLIRETADQRDVSMAEILRELIEKGMEYDDRVADLERQVERLQNEKRALIQNREEHTELVEYVEQQRELTQYQERRQRMLDTANILTRWKWSLTGVPVDGNEE